MDSTYPEHSISELQDQVSIAEGQLHSLDEHDEEYEVRKMVLEHGIASLKEQIEELQSTEEHTRFNEDIRFQGYERPSTAPAFGNPRVASSNQPILRHSGFAAYAGSSPRHLGVNRASERSATTQNGFSAMPAWNFGGLNDPITTPDTPNFPVDGNSASASTSSPESGFMRPPKRQRASLGLSSDHGVHKSKSIRTTPSPVVTGNTSPSSTDAFEFADNSELSKILGTDVDEDLREMREAAKAQKEFDRLRAERERQEREDLEYALSLQQSLGDEFLPPPYSSAPESSASQSTFQTILDNQGRFRRPNPLSSSTLTVREDPFSLSTLPKKQESSYSNNNYVPIKSERSYHGLPTRIPSSDFINLDSDEELDNHPSSDVVEIDRDAFPSNSRYGQNTNNVPGAFNSYGSNGASNSTGNFGLPGGHPHVRQSIYDGVRDLSNSAYNLLDNQFSSFAKAVAGLGGNSVYGSNSVGSSNFVDLTASYDPQPQDFANDVFRMNGINPEDPVNRDLYDSYMDRLDYVRHDPTKTAEEIKTLLENIRPDEDLPPEDREGTPEAMRFPLMEHQKLGLAWMKMMEEGSNKGGILADDMGLGKTIQALALIVSRPSNDPTRKTTLIVCPVGLLKQWEREIETKLKPSHRLKTHILHGDKRDVQWSALRKFDVVLTTFGTLSTESKRKAEIDIKKRANPNWRPSSKADHLPLLGDDCKWYRVIIDEAQCIKNKNTKAATGAALLRADTRFCMTGTPMMNSVNELYSLIHFLRIKPYCEAEKFRRDFTSPLKGQSEGMKEKAMKQLQALLKAILLRRNKKSEIDGRPILNLPERTTEPRHATFSQDELDFYKALETRTQLQFNKFLKAGTVGRNYSNILVLLLRLRQACCHPHLIKDFGQVSGTSDITPADMIKLAKELAPDVVERLKEQCGQNDDCALECPVCMDMTDNATIFLPCGHNTCSECFARISDPSQAIAEGNAGEGRTEVKCPNCRGKIDPSKTIDSMTFKKVYMPEKVADELLDEDSQAEIETADESESDDDDEDEEVDSKGNIKGFIVNDEIVDDTSETEDEGDGAGYRSGKTPFEKSAAKKHKKFSKGKGKAKLGRTPKKTLAQLHKEGKSSVKAHKRYFKRLNKTWIPSAKIEKTLEILKDVMEGKDTKTKEGEKVIIFSQFTSLLDLLEIPINNRDWGYRRYDGSMSSKARNDAVIEFTEKRNCRIFLVSLKAGNAGLNLVAASQVIILDPFWNPYIEEQAIDRAHRIGQQKPVQVHRILVPDTVEDRILALQEKKRELIEGALDEAASKNISRLGVRELGFLFDVPT